MGSNLNKPPFPWALIVIYVTISSIVLIVGFRYSSGIREKMINARREELGRIADLQIDQIVQWKHEKQIDAEVIEENIPIIRQIGSCIYHKRDESEALAIISWMNSFVKNLDYLNANIIDNKGRVRFASPADDTIIGPNMRPLIPKALLSKKLIFTDFHQIAPGQIVHLDLIIPLFLTNSKDTLFVGLMVLRIDPNKKLYPLISKWSSKTRSSETLLIKRAGDSLVYLNDLKYLKDAALRLKKPVNETNLIGSMAVKGFEGVTTGIDYRNTPVMAAVRKVPETDWFMISKVDLAEVTKEASGEFILIRILIFIIIASFSAITGWTIWHLRARFYKDKYESWIDHEALSKHFSYILKHANDIIILMDKDLNIVEANDTAFEFYQYSREELIGMSINRLRLPESKAQLDGLIIDMNDKKAVTFETHHRRKDGRVFTLQISARLFEIEGKEYYQSIGRDITEQKNAEIQLENSFWLLKATIESTADGLLVVDSFGKIVTYNSKFTQMWSIPEEILEKRDDEVALKYVLGQVKDPDNFAAAVNDLYALPEKVSFDNIERVDGKVFERYSQPQWINDRIVGRVWSFRDVTDKKTAEKQLIRAKELAEESDRLKTAFLHNISHEIRTPMNAIVGFSALLDDPAIDDTTRRNYTGIITQSTNQLLSLISDIVEISNIEAGQVKLSFNEVNINIILNDIYNQFTQDVKKPGIEFHCQTTMPDERAIIITDKTKLIQIITNLLNNAFKFTEKGDINFGYRIEDHDLIFFVRDTGIGISENLNEKIFERFYQVESDSSRKYGGAGLGLSICKAYSELLGGKIKVISVEGKGSEFCFVHPL